MVKLHKLPKKMSNSVFCLNNLTNSIIIFFIELGILRNIPYPVSDEIIKISRKKMVLYFKLKYKTIFIHNKSISTSFNEASLINYSVIFFATTTIRLLAPASSQVERVINLSPYSAVTLIAYKEFFLHSSIYALKSFAFWASVKR